MHPRLLCGLALTCLFTASGAAAGVDEAVKWPDDLGRYHATDFGVHVPQTISSHSLGAAPDGRPYDWRWRLNSDWSGFGRLGWRFSPHFRSEIEVGYRQSGLNRVMAPTGRPGEPAGLCSAVTASGACVRPFGRSDMVTGMINAIYDFMPERRLEPFAGVGVGFAHIQFYGQHAFSNTPGPVSASNPAGQTLQLGGTLNRTSQFAYQALVGLSWRASHRVHFDLTYRFVGAPFLHWESINTTPGLAPGAGLRPGDFKGALYDHAATLGLRYGF